MVIKKLLKKGFSLIKITIILGLTKQKINYWTHTEIKAKQFLKKIKQKILDKICNLASDKTTSQIGSKKISAIINNDLEKDIIVDSNANPQTISYRTIWSYLNEEFWNPIKIRKSLF